jgi:hypothetical protein
MRMPGPEGNYDRNVGVSGRMERKEDGTRMLFFSRSRADLGLTLWLAAALVLCTMVLFQLDDGDVQLMTYNQHMREASCTVLDGQLEHDVVPQDGAPPDIGIPDKDKASAEYTTCMMSTHNGFRPAAICFV